MSVLAAADRELLELARSAAGGAYAPYSRFHVGAALRSRDGRVVTGVNVENAVYGLGVCAERTLLSRAVCEGIRPGDVEVVAITAAPCGGCRQWLREFAVERIVFDHEGVLRAVTLDELLPWSFGPEVLGR